MALMSTLTSNWNAGIDAAWDKTQGDNPTLVTASGGSVTISHTTVGGYNDLRAVAEYVLTGSYGYVQVTDYGNQSITSHECIFLMTDNTFQNSVQFIATGNSLFAYKTVANVTTAIGSSITLDTTAHKWLRIREASGTTFWDTSPDGVVWTNRWSSANPITVTALIPLIRCGIWQNEASGSQMTFDNFNTLGAAVTNTGQFFTMF